MFRVLLFSLVFVCAFFHKLAATSVITDSGDVYNSRIYPLSSSSHMAFVPKGIARKLNLQPNDAIQIVVERTKHKGVAVLRPHIGTILSQPIRQNCQRYLQAKIPLVPEQKGSSQINVFDSQGSMILRGQYNIVATIDGNIGLPHEHNFCAFNSRTPKLPSIKTKDPKYTGSFWSVVENKKTNVRNVTYHVIPTQSDFDFWIGRVPHVVISDISTAVGGKRAKHDPSRDLNMLFNRTLRSAGGKIPPYYWHVMALMGEVHPHLKNQYSLTPASLQNIKNLPYFAASRVLSKVPASDARKLLKTHKIVENKKRRSTKVTLPSGIILSIKGRGAMVHRDLFNAKGFEGRVLNIDDTPIKQGKNRKK